jgi:hypothetical protein
MTSSKRVWPWTISSLTELTSSSETRQLQQSAPRWSIQGPPPWEPPPSDELRRVIPLTRQHRLLSGDQLVLISLKVWSVWLDLRYAVYATPEPEGELPRPEVMGRSGHSLGHSPCRNSAGQERTQQTTPLT